MVKTFEKDWNLPNISRRKLVELIDGIAEETGGYKPRALMGLVFLGRIAKTDKEEFAELLALVSDRNLEYVANAIADLHDYFSQTFKPEQDQLDPISDLTEMAQVDSDDAETARVEFEDNSPNEDMTGIMRAEIARSTIDNEQ